MEHMFTRVQLHTMLLAAYLSIMLTACDHSTTIPTASPESNNGSSPPQVQIGKLEQTQISEPIYSTGTVVAHKTTSIVPLVGGLIEEIFVKVGDRVEQGDPLLRLRQREFELSVVRLTHARDLAQAELEDAQRDLDNAIKLSKREAFSQEQLDDRRTRVSVSMSQLGIAETNLSAAQQDLEDSFVKAPFRGVITKRFVDEGSFVPSVMRSESPVLQIQKIDIVVVVLFVPEIHLASISPGMRGVVHIPSLDQTFESSVVLINDSHDLKTRTIEVRIGIANPDYLIKPGLFVEVELYPEPHYAQILPPESIIGIGQDTHVLVMEDGKAKRVDLTVKELSDGRLELLSELDPGANIIADKQRHTLEPGYPVTVDTPP